MTDSKAALRTRAEDYVYQRSPLSAWMQDERRNRAAFQMFLANPLQVSTFFAGYLAVKGWLPPQFTTWSPQERFTQSVEAIAALYNDGWLGGMFPYILSDIRANHEAFGHASPEAVDKVFATFPEPVRAAVAEFDKLQTVEALAFRAVEADLAAGRTPTVFADAAPAGPPGDPDLRSALETAIEVHRPPDSGAAADRDAIREGLRDGSLTQAEAVGLALQLDREAAFRGDIKPYTPQNSREFAVKSAARLHEIRSALAAGEAPPPATDFLAPQVRGPTPAGPADVPFLRHGAKGLKLRDALDIAYEHVHHETTGSYSPDLTNEPTDAELREDAEAGARIDAGRETLRDVVHGAWDLAAKSPGVEPSPARGPVSTREALDAAWDANVVDDSRVHEERASHNESLRDTLERAASTLED